MKRLRNCGAFFRATKMGHCHIYDEAQKIKNPPTGYTGCKALQADFQWSKMDAVENSLTDLWCLFFCATRAARRN